MKAQLAHLKALMKEATRDRHPSDSDAEAEAEEEVQAVATVNSSRNSIDRQSDIVIDDSMRRKSRSSIERPTIDQVQVSNPKSSIFTYDLTNHAYIRIGCYKRAERAVCTTAGCAR